MRAVCAILVLFALIAWRVEAGSGAPTYPRATMTPDAAPIFPTGTPVVSYPYPAPSLAELRGRVFLPVVRR